jgi:hypothetical protein
MWAPLFSKSGMFRPLGAGVCYGFALPPRGVHPGQWYQIEVCADFTFEFLPVFVASMFGFYEGEEFGLLDEKRHQLWMFIHLNQLCNMIRMAQDHLDRKAAPVAA